MSRSGYDDDCDYSLFGLWRGAVASAIRGKRGQQLLRETLAALDAMPVKKLAADSLVTAEGEFCTLGVLGAQRGINLDRLDPDDAFGVADAFGISQALVREIVFENDEGGPWLPYPEKESPEARWRRMRDWVEAHLGPEFKP